MANNYLFREALNESFATMKSNKRANLSESYAFRVWDGDNIVHEENDFEDFDTALAYAKDYEQNSDWDDELYVEVFNGSEWEDASNIVKFEEDYSDDVKAHFKKKSLGELKNREDVAMSPYGGYRYKKEDDTYYNISDDKFMTPKEVEKEIMSESMQLNEGPGAGIEIECDIDATNVSITSVNASQIKDRTWGELRVLEFEGNLEFELTDFVASTYYRSTYDSGIERMAIKAVAHKGLFLLEDDDEMLDANSLAEELLAFGGKIHTWYGGGWSYSNFDGSINEGDWIDDSSNYMSIKLEDLKIVDEEIIDEIDYLVDPSVIDESLNEDRRSREDAQDSYVIRSIAYKVSKDPKADLSPDEEDIIDKYNLVITRNGRLKTQGGSIIPVEDDLRPHSWDGTEFRSRIDAPAPYIGLRKDKYRSLNLADYARKADDRANKRDENGPNYFDELDAKRYDSRNIPDMENAKHWSRVRQTAKMVKDHEDAVRQIKNRKNESLNESTHIQRDDATRFRTIARELNYLFTHLDLEDDDNEYFEEADIMRFAEVADDLEQYAKWLEENNLSESLNKKSLKEGFYAIDTIAELKDELENVAYNDDDESDWEEIYNTIEDLVGEIVNVGLREDSEKLVANCRRDGDAPNECVSMLETDLLDTYNWSRNDVSLSESLNEEVDFSDYWYIDEDVARPYAEATFYNEDGDELDVRIELEGSTYSIDMYCNGMVLNGALSEFHHRLCGMVYDGYKSISHAIKAVERAIGSVVDMLDESVKKRPSNRLNEGFWKHFDADEQYPEEWCFVQSEGSMSAECSIIKHSDNEYEIRSGSGRYAGTSDSLASAQTKAASMFNIGISE